MLATTIHIGSHRVGTAHIIGNPYDQKWDKLMRNRQKSRINQSSLTFTFFSKLTIDYALCNMIFFYLTFPLDHSLIVLTFQHLKVTE